MASIMIRKNQIIFFTDIGRLIHPSHIITEPKIVRTAVFDEDLH